MISLLSRSDPDEDGEDGEHGTVDYAKGSKPNFDVRRLEFLVDNDPERKDVPARASVLIVMPVRL